MSATKYNDNAFVEGLDTIFQLDRPHADARRVHRLLTGGALFSKNFAFSDTMLIDNLGFRHLFLTNSAFRNLVSEIGVAGIRRGSETLLSVVDKQIKAGMIFSSLPDGLKSQIRNNKPDELTISPDQVFSERPDYLKYIEALDTALNTTSNKFVASWEIYETVLQRLIDNNINELGVKDARYILEDLIERTRNYVASKGRNRIDRSDYYKVVQQGFGLNHTGSKQAQKIVVDFFVDRAYRDNFWVNNDVAIVSHTSKTDSELYKLAFPERVKELQSIDSPKKHIFHLPSVEIDTKSNLSLDHLDFDFHVELRRDNTALEYLDAIYEATDPRDAQLLLRDYRDFLDGKIVQYFSKKKKSRLLKLGKTIINVTGIIASSSSALYSLLRGAQYLSPGIEILLTAGIPIVVYMTSQYMDEIPQRQAKIETDLKDYIKASKLS